MSKEIPRHLSASPCKVIDELIQSIKAMPIRPRCPKPEWLVVSYQFSLVSSPRVVAVHIMTDLTFKRFHSTEYSINRNLPHVHLRFEKEEKGFIGTLQPEHQFWGERGGDRGDRYEGPLFN